MDLIKTFKPFFTVLQFYGLTSHKIVKNGKYYYFVPSNFLYVYSRFAFCINIIIQIMITNKLKTTWSGPDNFLVKIVSSFDIVCLMFNALFGMYIGLKESPAVYKQLNKWNVFQKENIHVQSKSSRRGRAIITFLSLFHFVYPLFLWLTAGVSHIGEYKKYTTTIFVYFLDIYISGSISHKFLVCISVVGISYIKMKQIVEKEYEDYKLQAQDVKSKPRFRAKFMKMLLVGDSRLKDLTDQLNSAYGPIALGLMMLYFTEAIYSLSKAFVFGEGSVATGIWFSYNIVQFATTCIICSFAKMQADSFSQQLHMLCFENEDSDVAKEILHRDINLDACGFFKLNMSLFYSMAGIVTTYLIILIQFKNAQPPQINNCTAIP